MPFKIDRNGAIASVTTLVFTGDVEVCLNVFSEYQGCHTDGLSLSVNGGLIIYILTLAALNVWKSHFLTWVLLVNQNPVFYDFTENG